MFTSRAEHRLVLRHDNADLRLTEIGGEMGLASSARLATLRTKKEAIAATRHLLQTTKQDQQTWAHLLKRPTFFWSDLPATFQTVDPDVAAQLETEIKYEGYLKREQAHIERNRADEDRTIPDWINFDIVPGLKAEARVKLKKIQPRTFGQVPAFRDQSHRRCPSQVHAKRGKTAAMAIK